MPITSGLASYAAATALARGKPGMIHGRIETRFPRAARIRCSPSGWLVRIKIASAWV
jgi:hypothetical protein